jgi:hypothetical protein
MGGLDAFVLLTPILVLGVLALLAFVGCSIIYNPDNLPSPCSPLHDLSATPGDGKVLLSWQGYPSGVEPERLTVKRGTTRGGPYSIAIEFPPEVLTSQQPGQVTYTLTYTDTTGLQNGVTYYYVVTERSHGVDDCASTNEAWGTTVPPFVTSKTLGTIRQGFTGFAGMVIAVASNPLTIYALGRIVAPGNSGPHEVKIVDAATNADVPGSNVLVSTAGGNPGTFAYADLANPVTLVANATYFIVSRETDGLNQDQWYNNDTTVLTANVANVTGSVYGDGVSVPPYTIDKASDTNGNYTYGPVDFKYYGSDRGTD